MRVAGSTNEMQYIWGLSVASGRFLLADPERDAASASSDQRCGRVVRCGFTLGQYVRLGDRRFRVAGVLAAKGEFVGIAMDEIVFIPVASAQSMFNLRSLLRVGVMTRAREDVPRVKETIERVLADRHGGERDVTIIREDAVSSAFDTILIALTFSLGGIAAISMAVAGILIMNVMLIAVVQRTSEIGLLKSLGASGRQIRTVFFAEAALLSTAGGVVGLIVGQIGSFVIRRLYPAVPAYAPAWAVAGALLLAIATGVAFTVLPARRAAALDPAAALARR